MPLLTLAALLGVGAAPPAHAQLPLRQSGTFAADDSNAQYNFTLGSAQEVYAYTTGYAGGTNLDGTTTVAGGFDPILSLFDGNGSLLMYNDDNPLAPSDPATGAAYDSGLLDTLGAGSYTLAITQYDNFSNGSLSSGFQQDGNPTFTSQYVGGGTATAPFVDVNGSQRTGNYTLNLAAFNVVTQNVTLNLGSALVGSSTTNGFSIPGDNFTLLSSTLTGPGAGDFSFTTPTLYGQALTPSQNYTFDGTFFPIALGLDTATLHFLTETPANTATGTPASFNDYNYTVIGNGVPPSVPEPSAWTLLGLGSLGLIVPLRRARRARAS